MFKYILLGLLLTQVAEAQILSGLLGRSNSSDIQVRWDCPQHDYPRLRQLPQRSTTKIKIELKNGRLTTSLKPDIFKSSPLRLSNLINQITGEASLSLDYSDCITHFKESVQIAVENFQKSSHCQNQSSHLACTTPAELVDQSLDNMINQSAYFRRVNNQFKLPRFLPLSNKNLDDEQVHSIIQDLRRGRTVASENLYSREVFNHIANRLGSVNSQVLEDYQKGFNSYQLKFQEDYCHLDTAICNHLREKLTEANNEVVTKTNRQKTALQNYNDPSLTYINAPLDETEATEELKRLLEKEPFSCDFMSQNLKSGNRFFQVSQFPEALSKNLDLLGERADTECIRQVLQNLSVSMSYRQEMTQEFWDRCDRDWTAACEVSQRRKELVLENFRKIWSLNFGDLGEQYLSQVGSLVCNPDQNNPSKTIADIIADHRKTIACMELKPGQAKPVTFGDGTPAGLWGRYVIKKKQNGDHEILVGVDVTADGYGVRREEMQDRIKTCMSSISPYMKGPDGKALDFRILTPTETLSLPSNERPGVNPISIQAPNFRSNSASYEADIDCPTIAHEVLHLLGLYDEYDGGMDGYTCRTSADVPSIMSSHRAAFGLAVPKTLTCECRPGSICDRVRQTNDPDLREFYLQPSAYTITNYDTRNKYCQSTNRPPTNWNNLVKKSTVVIQSRTETSIHFDAHNLTDYSWPRVGVSRFTCRCQNENDQECIQALADMEQSIQDISEASLDYCPSGSSNKEEVYGDVLNGQTIWTSNGLRFVKKAKEPSLLHPNHYERIVGGSCATKAVKYNECAVWAYKSKAETNNCEGRPTHCENGREFLGLSGP